MRDGDPAPANGRSFTIGDSDFLLDGEPFRILSGAIHYFRVHPDQWADRIRKARLMGLNTIETYVAWNAHEPRPGRVGCLGRERPRRVPRRRRRRGHARDRAARPVHLRRVDERRAARLADRRRPASACAAPSPATSPRRPASSRRVYEIVAPRQIDRGGNVILVQIENEYGAYGADKEYLARARRGHARCRHHRAAHHRRPAAAADAPRRQPAGRAPHRLVRVPRDPERLATLREHQPTGPLMCMEFWDGWFDWWGGHHHTTDPADAAADLETLLAAGASVNFYMFHGGTNFGLTNGANDKGRYLPIVTSYDYDAPLDEAGNPTAKYFAFRDVIARYAHRARRAACGGVLHHRRSPSSFTQEEIGYPLPGDPASQSDSPPTFDELGFDGGAGPVRGRPARADVASVARIRRGA